MTQIPFPLLSDVRVVIKGAGDLATGVAFRLWRAGFPVALTELEQPLAIRRAAVLAEAIYAGVTVVEGQEARRAASVQQVEEAWRAGAIPVLASATPEIIAALRPTVVVDGIMAKHNTGTHIDDAALVIALGPGFVAGRDVHAVVETNRGHYLGRVIWDGSAQQDTGAPGEIGGQSRKRVIYAPCDGIFRAALAIGARVREGDLLGAVDGTPLLAPTTGVVRGLIHDGLRVTRTLKIGDVDPRVDRGTLLHRLGQGAGHRRRRVGGRAGAPVRPAPLTRKKACRELHSRSGSPKRHLTYTDPVG